MVITDAHKNTVTGSGHKGSSRSVRTVKRTVVRKMSHVSLYTYILNTNRDLLTHIKSNFTDFYYTVHHINVYQQVC
jgi:hypothetical protein